VPLDHPDVVNRACVGSRPPRRISEVKPPRTETKNETEEKKEEKAFPPSFWHMARAQRGRTL